MGLLAELLARLRALDERILGDARRHVPQAPSSAPAREIWGRLGAADRRRAREALIDLEVPRDPEIASVVAGLAADWSAALAEAPPASSALASRLTAAWIERLHALRRACETASEAAPRPAREPRLRRHD